MENTANIVSGPADKKPWAAPELKKVDIGELTAHLNLLGHANEDGPS
jgi:hypothetical protein